MEKEFTGLINKHQAVLLKICNVYFYRNPYKEDYYQEMLIRLWKSYPAFKGQCAVSTWFYRVALNTAIDILRKETIRPAHVGLSEREHNRPAPDHLAGSDNRDRLYAAINQLLEVDKAIIVLHLEGYGNKEIAEITGISAGNTGVKINRIKNQLLKILGNEN